MFPGPARRLLRLLFVTALLCALVPAAAHAATYTVDRSDDADTATACTGAGNDCSLRGALLDVEGAPDIAGDTIVIPAITVSLDGELPRVDNTNLDLAITGAGARSTTIDAQQNGRILEIDGGSVSFQSLVLTSGTTTGDGGALLNNGGTLDVQESGIVDSHADNVGGGIANDDGTLTVERSLIYNNSGYGAAIDVDGGTASITNTTITGNTGPYSVDSDTTSGDGTVLSFVTVTGNDTTDSQTSEAFYANAGSVNNSIIAGNIFPDPSSDECSHILATGYVIDDDGSCVDSPPVTGSSTVDDAMLGSLTDNGGPTDTIALLTGSPAIDAADPGVCPATDQRGFGRPAGAGCDIGAFEAGAVGSGGGGGGGGSGAPALPTVSGVSPASGPAGTFVGIAGHNLSSATQVMFGGVPTAFTIDGYEHLTAVAPAGGTGQVDIRVVNPAGTSVTSPSDVFTYTSSPGDTPSGTQGSTSTPAPKQVCVMPNLLRHSYRYAKKLLAHAGCVGTLSHKGHAKHPPSHVKRQSPDVGAPLLQGATISLKLG